MVLTIYDLKYRPYQSDSIKRCTIDANTNITQKKKLKYIYVRKI